MGFFDKLFGGKTEQEETAVSYTHLVPYSDG